MGKILHEGTYATIREAYHVDTGEAFACKIIDKRLLRGREYLVGNEIELLNRVSYAHSNIVTLHDYFESDNHLYLCFDLCTGGNLSQRISSQGPYSEAGASYLIHTLLSALRSIHSSGLVHGDLTPSTILFRSEDDDTEVMIADFGVSRLVGDTGNRPGHGTTATMHERDAYVAPERFRQGYCTLSTEPADVWAIGVLAYYMLIGHAPFHEMHRDDADDFLFDHVEGKKISGDARDFVEACLIVNPYRRPTVEQVLRHKIRTGLNE
ncbi:kinase-like domain-containing protein [Favolaschia claudopus]|uniref:Kinase-like domain-containing protein n=1 Tax=Favolaschia claudopus TaxID=2862362 RepID=A0AAW0CLU8_9AGAR